MDLATTTRPRSTSTRTPFTTRTSSGIRPALRRTALRRRRRRRRGPKQEPAELVHPARARSSCSPAGRCSRFVPPDRRDAVRERMLWVAATYEQTGASIEPVPDADYESPAAAAAAARRRGGSGTSSTTSTGRDLARRHAATDAVMTLADAVVDRLAAAGHAAIYFSLLARTAASSRAAWRLIRPLVREIARLPELRIEWMRDGLTSRRPRQRADASVRPRARGDAAPRPPRERLRVPDRAPGRQRRRRTRRDRADAARRTSARRGRGHHSRRRAVDAPGRPGVRARTAGRIASRCRRRCSASGRGSRTATRRPRSPRPTSPRSAPRKVRATSTSTGVRSRRTVAVRDALDADPETAASAVFHAPDDQLDGIVPELAARGGDARGRAPREVHARVLRRAAPTRSSGGCTSRPRRTSRRGGRPRSNSSLRRAFLGFAVAQ